MMALGFFPISRQCSLLAPRFPYLYAMVAMTVSVALSMTETKSPFLLVTQTSFP